MIDLHGEEICELFIAEAGIAVSVNASYDRECFLLTEIVSKGTEEVLQVVLMDRAFIETVNGAEGSEGGVIRTLA